VLSVNSFDFLVTLVTMSGSGALQLMPAILGVCFPSRHLTTRAGVLAGIAVGLGVLYATLVVWPNPLGVHAALWSLGANALVTAVVSRFTRPPSAATVRRVHGAIEEFVYGDA
jgi:SSS family solute:Na+ symporter